MSDELFIIRSTAVLGPPTTDRTYRQGEVVTEADFGRQPEVWAKLLRRGSISPARDEELEEAFTLRLANARSELGLQPDASTSAIQQALESRRAGLVLAAQRVRALMAARAQGLVPGVLPPAATVEGESVTESAPPAPPVQALPRVPPRVQEALEAAESVSSEPVTEPRSRRGPRASVR